MEHKKLARPFTLYNRHDGLNQKFVVLPYRTIDNYVLQAQFTQDEWLVASSHPYGDIDPPESNLDARDASFYDVEKLFNGDVPALYHANATIRDYLTTLNL